MCIKVKEDQCIGCGACIAIDPEHFDFNPENGTSTVISNENIDSEAVKEAIDACPVGAISKNENIDTNPVETISKEEKIEEQ